MSEDVSTRVILSDSTLGYHLSTTYSVEDFAIYCKGTLAGRVIFQNGGWFHGKVAESASSQLLPKHRRHRARL